MAIETHHDPHSQGHGDFERKDVRSAGIFYFFAGLAAAAIVIHLLLAGLYEILDKRDKAQQPPPNPLVANMNPDTRKVPLNYPQNVFPEPRLETNERTQLDDVRLAEEQKLNGYDWVDQKSGIVRIPIDRAMDLIAQRGLPVRPQNANANANATTHKKGSSQ